MNKRGPGAALRGVLPILVCLASVSCIREARQSPTKAASRPMDSLYVLEAGSPVFEQVISPDVVRPESQKFVVAHIETVYNPKRHSVLFELHRRSGSAERALLGTFSLFPPDNPGRFIVATRGTLRAGDTLILSMRSPDRLTAADTLWVRVRRLELGDE